MWDIFTKKEKVIGGYCNDICNERLNSGSESCVLSVMMATVRLYREEVRYLSRTEVSQERLELLKIINGDAFFPLEKLPRDLRMAFWKKPIGDKDAFKLMLFCLGNGCSPNLITRWILLAQSWAPEKAEKRARQIDYILNNADQRSKRWFYFDVDYNKLLYLNGLPKQWR